MGFGKYLKSFTKNRMNCLSLEEISLGLNVSLKLYIYVRCGVNWCPCYSGKSCFVFLVLSET